VFRQRDLCVLFLDEGFGHRELGPALEGIGYSIVCHQKHHNKRQGIKDDEIIPDCAKNNWLLVTTDKNMVLRYRDLLKQHRQALVFTSNNHEKYDTWIRAFENAKVAIERHWKKTEPPWVGRLHPTGLLEVSSLLKYTRFQTESVKEHRRKK
jgi:hypothetical protein